MKRYPYRTAEKIMWAGAISLALLCFVVGYFWGFLAQVPLFLVMLGWGVFVRRYMTQKT